MTLIIALFAVGIVLVSAEILVPGAILGCVGAVFMFAACALSFAELGTMGGFIALAAAILISALVFYIEFRILPKTRLGRRAFLTAEVTGVSAALGKEAASLVGREAEALTLLSPSGYVRVAGERYEAFCQSGQAPVGSVLEVIGADSFRLIVTQSTPAAP